MSLKNTYKISMHTANSLLVNNNQLENKVGKKLKSLRHKRRIPQRILKEKCVAPIEKIKDFIRRHKNDFKEFLIERFVATVCCLEFNF